MRVCLKALGLSWAALFLALMHGLAQSLITTYVGPPLPVSGNPALNQAIDYPSTVVPDGAGGMYVVSTNQNRVYAISTDGTLRLVAGSSYGFSGDGGPATNARLASPSGLALDSSGNLYITDSRNNRIRKVTADGVITTIAGTGIAGFSGDGGPATSAQLSLPRGLAVDAAGNIYIADATNNRVRKVGADGVISTLAGNGTAPPVIGANPVVPANGVQATSTAISPTAVAVDAAGNLYITSGFVLRVSPDGILTTLTFVRGDYTRGGFICSPNGDGGPSVSASVCSPSGVALDAAGNLYVAESTRIRKITTDGLIQTVAGGNGCMSGADGMPATSVCFMPTSVAVDTGGSLYVSEWTNRVRTVTPDGVITTILRNTIEGFAGDGGPAASAQIAGPGPIALDKAGNLYLDANARIRKVTTDGVISTIAGTGVPGFTGDGGPATSAAIGAPRDMVVDASNNIYILDLFIVREITTDGVITTIAGCSSGVCIGSPDADGIAARTALATPQRIAVDSAGTLYIAELDRVRKVTDGMITTILGNGAQALGGNGGPPGLNHSDFRVLRWIRRAAFTLAVTTPRFAKSRPMV